MESEEKARDLQKENTILRESNNKLLDSAYDLERERQFHATENALKVGSQCPEFGKFPNPVLYDPTGLNVAYISRLISNIPNSVQVQLLTQKALLLLLKPRRCKRAWERN